MRWWQKLESNTSLPERLADAATPSEGIVWLRVPGIYWQAPFELAAG
jgi:hypothetical protein